MKIMFSTSLRPFFAWFNFVVRNLNSLCTESFTRAQYFLKENKIKISYQKAESKTVGCLLNLLANKTSIHLQYNRQPRMIRSTVWDSATQGF